MVDERACFGVVFNVLLLQEIRSVHFVVVVVAYSFRELFVCSYLMEVIENSKRRFILTCFVIDWPTRSLK